VVENRTFGAWSVRRVGKLRLHLAEGPAVLLPKLPKAVVAVERLRDRDVAHLAVLGVDLDEGLDVLFLLQLPQRLYEAVSATSLDMG
jgi:hypothetical protein